MNSVVKNDSCKNDNKIQRRNIIVSWFQACTFITHAGHSIGFYVFVLWPWPLTFWPNINYWWARTRDGLSLWQILKRCKAMPKDGTTHTKLWFLIYLCARTRFSAYRDIAWCYGKEGRRRWPGSRNMQDTEESPTAARRADVQLLEQPRRHGEGPE